MKTLSPQLDASHGQILNPQETIESLLAENASLKKKNQELELLNRMAKAVAEEYDVKKIMQAVIDTGTQLCGAKTGAFFHNTDLAGNSYILYSISGSALEASSFILPNYIATASVYENKIICSDDITTDEQNFAHLTPTALSNLPFKSYMVVPVISKSGELLGRMFFTHEEKGAFSEKEQKLVLQVASHGAIAMEASKSVELKNTNLENFKSLAESIPQMVWTGREDGYIDFFNQQWLNYTGLTFEELKGIGWTRALHPEDFENTIVKWTAAVNAGTEFELEYRLKSGIDDSFRWHLGRAVPIKNAKGSVIKWFGTCTDVHDQKSLQEKKDQFFGIASHELKTPLTSIKAYIQLLERTLLENGPAKVYIEKANSHINRLNNLIADLLDVSKIQEGRLPFYISEFDFDHLIKDSLEQLQHGNHKHSIVIEGEINQQVRGDRQRLEQVFLNYLSNAIKYSPDGDKVIVRISKNSREIKVAVQDFGIGVPKESQAKIFDRFYRAESDCQKFAGLGIGLYLSSEIIKRHKGKTWVESLEGKGSTFYFSIPIKKDLKNQE